MTPGYHALQNNTAYFDSSARGRIKVTGEDRARLLHALTTNHIKDMSEGQQRYAFFLNAQGRIITDVWISCFADHFILEVEPVALDPIIKHIDHYIIADDVTIEDVSSTTFSLVVPGKRLYGHIDTRRQTIHALQLIEATPGEAEQYRIDNFHPLFGKDFSNSTLPQETGLLHALHFNKGCYLGQEIVERIRSRGHVNKTLVGLLIHPNHVVSPGAKVQFNLEDIGQITSSLSPSPGGLHAIAMVRIQGSKPGTIVQVEGFTAEVFAVS